MSELFISQAVTEEIKRKIAYSSSTYLANDIYFKMTAIDLFINSFGREKLKDMLINSESKSLIDIGNNFQDFLNKFYRIFSISSVAKLSQDTLKDKQLKNKDTFEYKRLVRDMKLIGCIRPQITQLYVFLIKNSMIKNMGIPKEYYKIIEHEKYKNLGSDTNKRKVGEPLNATS